MPFERAGSAIPMTKTAHKISAALNASSLSRISSSNVQPGKRSLSIVIGPVPLFRGLNGRIEVFRRHLAAGDALDPWQERHGWLALAMHPPVNRRVWNPKLAREGVRVGLLHGKIF